MKNQFPGVSPLVRAAVCAAFLALGVPAVASAQPAAAGDQALPSYATASHDEQIRGRISAITGKYTLKIRDDRGYLDNVTLHQGTIINPTGLQLAPGMQVTIHGTNAGSSFAANEIDTPYNVTVVQPLYPVYGAGFGWGPAWGWGGPWGAPWGWGPRFGPY